MQVADDKLATWAVEKLVEMQGDLFELDEGQMKTIDLEATHEFTVALCKVIERVANDSANAEDQDKPDAGHRRCPSNFVFALEWCIRLFIQHCDVWSK